MDWTGFPDALRDPGILQNSRIPSHSQNPGPSAPYRFNLVESQNRAVSPKPLPIAARLCQFTSQSHALQLCTRDRIDPGPEILEFGRLFQQFGLYFWMYIIIGCLQGEILNTFWTKTCLGFLLAPSQL